LEELIDRLKKENASGNYSDLMIDLSPWQVLEFPETFKGARQMKAKMIEIGFTFSPEEDQEWARWRIDE
jgi:hypothetical protein